MESRARWELAQEAEKAFWRKTLANLDTRLLIDMQTRDAAATVERLKPYLALTPETRTLQIGCTPRARIHRLLGKRSAIDPLADFFLATWSEAMDPAVDFRNGMGEDLPWGNDEFDLVICTNTLDHCEAPHTVAREILRVLKPDGGLILFAVHVFGRLGAKLHSGPLGPLLDRHHPHAWTREQARELFDIPGSGVEVTIIEERLRQIQSRSRGKLAFLRKPLVAAGLSPPMLSLIIRSRPGTAVDS